MSAPSVPVVLGCRSVGIASVAEMFDLTPTYLSRHFHQKTGVKFIKYVTEERIANARRIMTENPDILIRDVAMMVGHSSKRHFARLFFNTVGTCPSEHQAQLRQATPPSPSAS